MHFIAYTVKGLEDIAADEIRRLIANVQILESAPKRLIFETTDIARLRELRTVDDIGLLLGQAKVTSLDEVADFINTLDLPVNRRIIEQIRPNLTDTFSITTTLAGTRGYTVDDVIGVVGKAIEHKTKWQFTATDRSNFDIRIFIDRKELYCSVRLLANGLHERAYKTHSRQGSLRATIAAAMVDVATQGEQSLKIVDNFCGSGTILAEALTARNTVYGGDIEQESVEFTCQNLSNLRYDKPSQISQLDATKTKWPSNSFDCAISNLPWGKQIEIERITDLYRNTLQEYARILKPAGSLCLLVGSKPELLIKHAKLTFPNATIKTWRLGYLGQTPTIIFLSQDSNRK